MPTTVKIRRSGTASATPSALEHGEIAINYADGKMFWKNASNVITSFTFQSYALASHSHAASDITSGTLDAARLPLATTGAAGAVIVGTGLGVSSGTVSVTYGTNSTSACRGDDSRLSDARTPTSHAHGNITNAGAIGSTADQFVVTTTSGVLTAVSAATARTTLSVQPTASPTFTGTLTAATCSFSGTVTVTSPLVVTGTVAGNVRQLRMQTSGSTRWEVGPGFDAESGSNVGSTFWITRWSDSGVFLGTPIAIARATGNVTLENQLTVSSGMSVTGTVLAGISTAFDSTSNIQIGAASNPGIGIARTATPSNTNSIAGINGTAYDGAAYVAGGTINWRANENWSSTNHGTDIQFRATPAGSGGALTEVLRITGGGQTLVTAGSGSSGSYKPGMAISGDDDTGVQQVGGANTLSLVTAGNERLRVTDSRVFINGNGEQYGLGVRYVSTGGAVHFGATSNSATPDAAISNAGGGTLMTFANDGKITASGVYNNTVGGTNRDVFVDSGGLIGYVSSIRESKTDIVTLDDVSWLSALAPVSYRYRKRNADGTYSDEADGVTDYGLIAEDVEAVKPELCFYDDVDGEAQLRGVTYSKLITPMLRYIQQLEARIAALEERING
jgi:cytoskeletal protein CcmA (bactofilin family)